MSRRITRAALAATLTLVATPSLAADDEKVFRDLMAVIALQGLPCGQVISATQQRDNDYIVSCKDGNRYRVFVNAEGRVVVQKQ